MKERLTTIAQAEGCSEGELSLVDEILDQADGDMRRAVTTLQSVHSLAVGGGADAVTSETIFEISGLPPGAVVDRLWTAVQQPSFETMQQAVESTCLDGFSALVLLSSLLPKVVTDVKLNELSKSEIAIRIAEAEKNMIEGADEYLQLMTVCSLALTCFAKSRAKQ
jgi:replication factor C subunit 2/4